MRHSRTEMLLGKEGIERLRAARVAVFGLGGVGSYTAEALARAGVGHLDLVDKDVVEKSNINRQLCALSTTIGRAKMCIRDSLSTVYINGVGHGLEGVKGDANGQRQAQQGNIRMEEQVDVLNQKIAIFKKPQKSQVDDNGGDDGSLCPGRMAMLFNIEAVGIIADCGKQHKQNIDRLSPGVKNQAEEEKRQVFALLRHDKVGRQSQGQKKI